MKKIIAILSCISFLSLAASLYAQETLPTEEGSQTLESAKAGAGEESGAERENLAETKTGNEKKSGTDSEDLNPPEESPGAIKRTVAFVSSLPFGYDFGCEPTLHGSLIYFNAKYKWSEEKQIFTRLLFNYGTTLSLEPSSKNEFSGSADLKKYEDEEKAIDFRLIPYGKQINSSTRKGRYFTIEPGMNLRIEPEKRDLTFASYAEDEESGKMYFTVDMNQTGKRFIIRPYYSTTIATPLGKLFSVTLDLLYAPLYYYWGGYKLDFSAKGYSEKNGQIVESVPTIDMNYNGFAENYVDANLVVGLFNIVAASARFIYERRHKTDFSLTPDFSTTESENKYERLSLKVGGSLINIGKASMRIKAGIFYQWDWEYNHNEESWFTSGKWIFGVGMRNLY